MPEHIPVDTIMDLYRQYGILIAILLPFLDAFFLILPVSLFVILNVEAFGLVGGFLLSWIGGVAGCWTVYWITRSFHYHTWMKKVTQTNQYTQMQQKFQQHNGPWIALIYLIPIFPPTIMTVVAAINKMCFRTFAFASATGIGTLFLLVSYGTVNILTLLTPHIKLGVIAFVCITFLILSKKIKET